MLLANFFLHSSLFTLHFSLASHRLAFCGAASASRFTIQTALLPLCVAKKRTMRYFFMIKKQTKAFGKIKTLCACALLCAAAVSIAYVCKFMTVGSIRITFENLPIILSGIFFGPVAGFITGIGSDLVSTAISHYGLGGLNPIITLGAGAIGFVSGAMFRLPKIKNTSLKALLAVGSAHVVGNMLIKSIGLMVYYSYALPAVLPRVPLYIIIGAIEYAVILVLIRNKGITKSIEKLK